MLMNPVVIVLAWVGAYFIARALKTYVRMFAGWNIFLLMLLAIVIEAFTFSFGMAFLAPLFH